jgi:C1A family cysteine protease
MANLHKFGCKFDLPDERDLQINTSKLCAVTHLPDQIDLRKTGNISSVYDQGQIGSCLYNASATALDFVRKKTNRNFMRPSRLFAYYNGRLMEGTTNQDCGTQTRTAIKSLAKFGAPYEALWPYDISKVTLRPPLHTYNSAKDDLVVEYRRLETSPGQVLQVLATGYPVIFGFMVYTRFESSNMSIVGMLDVPGSDEILQGGHGVLAVGYDNLHKQVLVQNSYGKDWGLGGYFWISYDYLADPNLTSDFWVISEVGKDN